jgi:UDP-glucuronate 4-epimerase
MGLFTFTGKILAGELIEPCNNGHMRRAFTYIDDVVEGVVRLLRQPPTTNLELSSDQPGPAASAAPYRIYTTGNSQPVDLLESVRVLDGALGRKANTTMLPMQAGDVSEIYAFTADLEDVIKYHPGKPVADGLQRLVAWHRMLPPTGAMETADLAPFGPLPPRA